MTLLYTMMRPFRQPLLFFLPLAILSCTDKVQQMGYVDAESNLEKVKPGESHKQDVIALLGSPSTTSDFGDETWYYVAARQDSWGPTKPKLDEQQVTEIAFDQNDRVKQVDRYGLNDRDAVTPAKDTTPTEGHKLGFFEQVLGNVGRFNKPAKEAR